MYINLETKEVITFRQLEEANPGVGFPPDVGDESLEEFGYATVTSDELPSPSLHQSIAKGDVVERGGRYFQEYHLVDEPIPTSAVDTERDRRIELPITFQGNQYQNTTTDRENIAGAAQMGFMAMMTGAKDGDYRWSDPDNDFQWITLDNQIVKMDAQTVIEFGKASANRKQALIFSARALKDMSPIPTDYTADKWWA